MKTFAIVFLSLTAVLALPLEKGLTDVSTEEGWFVPQLDGSLKWMTIEDAEMDVRSDERGRKAKPVVVDFYLYTSKNPDEPQQIYINDIEAVKKSNFNKKNPTRYCSLTLITLLGIVSLRMAFLPGAFAGLQANIVNQKDIDFNMYIFMAPMLTLATFGPGWGCILSMASYNTFKTDINKYSWLICFSQLGILLLIGFLCMFTESHLTYSKPNLIIPTFDLQWTSFLSIPSSLATMRFSHLWTWMFLAVLIIGSFNLMIGQMFSILTALFDEYESLRLYKVEVTLGLSGILALASAYFCTENGIYFTEPLAELSVSSQAILNLLLLIIVVWVYGRERFQRDIEFMTSQVFQTWKIYAVRFVTPLFLGITLLIGLILLIFSKFHYYNFPESFSYVVFFTTASWLAVPVYCVLKLLQTNGSFTMRFKRCVKPTDWYPTDSEQRQRYEETIDNPETFQPLTTIVL